MFMSGKNIDERKTNLLVAGNHVIADIIGAGKPLVVQQAATLCGVSRMS